MKRWTMKTFIISLLLLWPSVGSADSMMSIETKVLGDISWKDGGAAVKRDVALLVFHWNDGSPTASAHHLLRNSEKKVVTLQAEISMKYNYNGYRARSLDGEAISEVWPASILFGEAKALDHSSSLPPSVEYSRKRFFSKEHADTRELLFPSLRISLDGQNIPIQKVVLRAGEADALVSPLDYNSMTVVYSFELPIQAGASSHVVINWKAEKGRLGDIDTRVFWWKYSLFTDTQRNKKAGLFLFVTDFFTEEPQRKTNEPTMDLGDFGQVIRIPAGFKALPAVNRYRFYVAENYQPKEQDRIRQELGETFSPMQPPTEPDPASRRGVNVKQLQDNKALGSLMSSSPFLKNALLNELSASEH